MDHRNDLMPTRRPADPDRRIPSDRRPAGQVLAIMLGALLLAAFVDSPRLLEDSEGRELGAGRDRALAIWRPIAAVAGAVGLDAAHDAADTALGRTDAPTVTIPVTTAGVIQTGDGPPVAPSTPAPTTTTRPDPLRLRDATAAAPLDVLLVGDSTLETVGRAAQRWFVDSGVAAAELDYRPATGLSRPDFFDWPSHVARRVGEDPPELAIAMFGANDAQDFLHEGEALEFGSDPWKAVYRARVGAVMDFLLGDDPDAIVVWIGQPVMRSADFNARMALVNSLYAAEADLRDRVVFFDTRAILTDGTGAYRPDGAGVDGSIRTLRASDGIHLTNDGGELVMDRLGRFLRDELGYPG